MIIVRRDAGSVCCDPQWWVFEGSAANDLPRRCPSERQHEFIVVLVNQHVVVFIMLHSGCVVFCC